MRKHVQIFFWKENQDLKTVFKIQVRLDPFQFDLPADPFHEIINQTKIFSHLRAIHKGIDQVHILSYCSFKEYYLIIIKYII